MIPRDLIGVIHIPAMPGDPFHSGASFDDVFDAALQDVDALIQGGILQMIVENFGSAPFRRGTAADPLDPHTHAFMARVVRAAVERGATVGVNCLRNDGFGALGIAAATGAAFIRVNVLSGSYVTDQGLIEGDAARLLRYRRALGAQDIAVIADVLVKHAAPLAPLTLTDAIHDVVHRGGAEAVIVSGAGTGQPTSIDDLEHARAATDKTLLVGSGATLASIHRLRSLVDGVIVGTALKRDGEVRAPVDPARVAKFVEAWA